MTTSKYSQRASNLRTHIEHIQTIGAVDPEKAAGIMSSALEDLQAILEMLPDKKDVQIGGKSKPDSILSSISDVLFCLDSELRYSYFNEKAKQQLIALCRNPDELMGMPLGSEFTTPQLDEILRCAMSYRTTLTHELYSASTGEWVESTIYPIADGGLSVLQKCITKRKLMEFELLKGRDILEHQLLNKIADLENAKEELLRAKARTEAAVQANADFLASISHELRTPINSVIGFTGLLLNEPLTTEQSDYVERTRNSGNALMTLVNDILEFTRAEKENLKLEQQPFGLRQCIEESLDLVSVLAKDKGLKLSHTISYTAPDTITGDPGRLRQVLVNLLANAVKYTSAGNVSLSISSELLEKNKHMFLFEVQDTGIGIPKDLLGELFQPFGQIEKSKNRGHKNRGVGLGLAISKKLVELMGGEIWAESTPGQGSTFRFAIPMETAPSRLLNAKGKAKTRFENLALQHPLRILVAEDNPSNQKVVVEMLKRMGYRPDAVADGWEVIQALESWPYDLIFMDVQMPEMDGVAATREIRRRWPTNKLKIVAITAYALEGDRERCLEAGMDDYIAKPIDRQDLVNILKKYTLESQ
jgi:signal transduction histidine kinase/CheY-like chemotaxis protein